MSPIAKIDDILGHRANLKHERTEIIFWISSGNSELKLGTETTQILKD